MLTAQSIAKLPIAKSYQTMQSQDDVLFNGNSLSDCGNLYAGKANYDDVNQIKLETFDAPQVDGGGVLSYFINGKTIEFTLVMKYDTEAELNNAMDDLKKKLAVPEGVLEVNINGTRRRASVALTSLKFNRDWKSKTIQQNVQIDFRAMNHFFSRDSDSKVFDVNGDYNIDMYYEGTVSTFFQVYMIFGAGNSGLTEVNMVKNGYTFTVPVVVADGDILLIDGVNKIVTLNGALIDYTGAFRELELGNNPFQILFNPGAVVNSTVTVIYNKQRL